MTIKPCRNQMILADTSVLIDLFKGNDNEAVATYKRFIQQGVPCGMIETVHLLKNPANAKHLSTSIQQYRDGKTERHELIDA